jgi:hypothetical protein
MLALASPQMHDHTDDDGYEVLAESDDCCVYRCEHGCLHLQIGDVNVRLEDSRFADLAAVIEEAAGKLPSPSVRWKVVRGPAH